MKISLSFISLFFTLLSCHKETPIQKEPCIATEQIIDSTSKVFTSKDWKYEYNAYAIKINDTSYFRAIGIRYNNKMFMSINLLGRDQDSTGYEFISNSNIPFLQGCNKITYLHSNQTLGIGSEYSTNDDDVIIDEYLPIRPL